MDHAAETLEFESAPRLRLREAARRLGVSPNTLRRWSDAGRIPCSRSPGGHRRFRPTDLDDYLRGSAVPPAPELTGPAQRSGSHDRAGPVSGASAIADAAAASLPASPADTSPGDTSTSLLADLAGRAARLAPDDTAAAAAFLHAVADTSLALAGADQSHVYILDGSVLRRRCSAPRPLPQTAGDTILDPADSPLTAAALTQRDPFLVKTPDDRRLTGTDRRCLSAGVPGLLLGLPLVATGSTQGVLYLTARPSVDLASRLDALSAVAALAGRVCADSRASSRAPGQRSSTSALTELARRAGATLDANDIAHTTLAALPALLPCTVATLYVEDGTGEAVSASITYDGRVPTSHSSPPTAELADVAARMTPRDAVLTLSPDDLGPGLRRGLAGADAAAAVALSEHDRVHGLLLVAGPSPELLTGPHPDLLRGVAAAISPALANAARHASLQRVLFQNLRALDTALGAGDAYSAGHSLRVAAYTALLGEELGWPHRILRLLADAATLHDIGKLGIPESVLLSSSLLTSREWESVYRHPVIAADILAPLYPPSLVAGIRHHHERWDGTGYPDGLASYDIPPVARALAVADAYDAMSSPRPYRESLSYAECRAEMCACRGTQFDPRMADAFLRVLDRLDDLRRIATATAQWAARRLDPPLHEVVSRELDPASSSYRAVAAVLRESLDQQPRATRALTLAAMDDHIGIVVDAAPAFADDWSPPGREPSQVDDYAARLSGRTDERNVLYLDDGGAWVTGTAAVVDDGRPVALVAVLIPQAQRMLEPLADQDLPRRSFAAMIRSTAQRLGRARQESITDHLTGLYNHRYLHERLTEEVERARESGSSLSLLFLDLDRFKQFNDRYGHSTGDKALRTVADAIQGAVRGVDLAARYGGEEFVVILVDTAGRGALDAAERIRRAIADASIADGVEHVTVSVGVATFPDDAERKEGLIDKADWAMYAAKRSGRDRVRSFSSGQLRLDLDATGPARSGAGDAPRSREERPGEASPPQRRP